MKTIVKTVPALLWRNPVRLCLAAVLATALVAVTNLAAQPPAPRPAPAPAPAPERPDLEPEAAVPEARGAPAAVNIVTGKILEVNGEKLVVQSAMTEDERVVVHERAFELMPETEIVLNKKPVEANELVPGDTVRVYVSKRNPLVAIDVVAARMAPEGDDEGLDPGNFKVRVPPGKPKVEDRRDVFIREYEKDSDVIWHGKIFVAPLRPDSPAARSGFRPGDMVLFVDEDQALPVGSDAVLRGLRIIETGSRSGFVIDDLPDQDRAVGERRQIRRSREQRGTRIREQRQRTTDGVLRNGQEIRTDETREGRDRQTEGRPGAARQQGPAGGEKAAPQQPQRRRAKPQDKQAEQERQQQESPR